MATGTYTREYKLFRRNFSDLAEGIGQAVEIFADKVFAENLITSSNAADAKNSTINSHLRASNLLHILLTRIKWNSDRFYVIRRVLESMPALKDTASMLHLEVN